MQTVINDHQSRWNNYIYLQLRLVILLSADILFGRNEDLPRSLNVAKEVNLAKINFFDQTQIEI